MPPSDREPDWWIQDVEVLDIVDQKEPVCSHLALLQRSVVQGVELVRGLVLKENAAGREKGVPGPLTRRRVSIPECVPARR